MIQVAGQAALVALELVLERSRLLQANHISVLLREEWEQAAARGRTYAIDVQGDDAHAAMIPFAIGSAGRAGARLPTTIPEPCARAAGAALRRIHAEIRPRQPVLFQRRPVQRWRLDRRLRKLLCRRSGAVRAAIRLIVRSWLQWHPPRH